MKLDQQEFTKEEVKFIEDWACWMSALAREEILPTSDGQRQFVAVTKGMRPPQTEREKIWMRYSSLASCKRCRRKVPSSKYSNSICPDCIASDLRESGITPLALKSKEGLPKRRVDPLGLAILREAEDQARE